MRVEVDVQDAQSGTAQANDRECGIVEVAEPLCAPPTGVMHAPAGLKATRPASTCSAAWTLAPVAVAGIANRPAKYGFSSVPSPKRSRHAIFTSPSVSAVRIAATYSRA